MWLPEGVTPDAKKLGGLHGVDERRHVVEEPQDFLGAGRGRVERRPGDADVTQLLQRAGVGFGALDGDGDVGVASRSPRGVLELLDPRSELLDGHAGARLHMSPESLWR